MMSWGGIFTVVMTIIGTGYGWLNPVVGLLIYWGFAILRPPFLWFWVPQLETMRSLFLVAISTLVGWAMAGFGDWSDVKYVKVPIFGLVLYILSGFFAWRYNAAGISPDLTWRAWDALYPQLTILTMVLVSLTLIRTERYLHALAWVITLTLGYLAYVFNSQYYFDGWNRVYWWGFGGVDNNGTAMMMVMGVPLAFFMGIHAKRWWLKAACFGSAICLIHVILFSFSRGGQLGLIMVGITIFIVAIVALPRKILTVTLSIIFVLIALRLAGAGVRERFMTIFADEHERDESAKSRYVTWAAARACIAEYPTGVGPRCFNLISDRYGLNRGKSVHNLYLQTAADYGVVGAFGLTLFYVGTIWSTFWMTLSKTAKRLVWPRYYGQMICTSIGGMLVCSTFIGMESVEVGFIICTLGLCTVAYVKRVAQTEPAKEITILPELEQVPPADEYEPQPA